MAEVVTQFRRVRYFAREYREDFIIDTAKEGKPPKLKFQLTGERGVFPRLYGKCYPADDATTRLITLCYPATSTLAT